jgi:hypothetical protein
MTTPTRYFVGLDLGRPAEPTALAVLGRPQMAQALSGGRPVYGLRHLQRFPPGTSYPAVVEAVAGLLTTPPLPYARLLADITGSETPSSICSTTASGTK